MTEDENQQLETIAKQLGGGNKLSELQRCAYNKLDENNMDRLHQIGFPIISVLSNYLEIKTTTIRNMILQNEINYDDFKKAILSTTSTGGVFYEAGSVGE